MYFSSYYRWLVIRQWVRVNPAARILDVGCNDGEIVSRIPGTVRVGFDLDPHCPDRTVRLVRGDALHLPFATSSFNTVLAFDIIEHIVDDRSAVKELLRVLSDQGDLWISTPGANFTIFPRFLTPRANRGWGHVRNGYTEAAIRDMVPIGMVAEIMSWNEPTLRLMQVALRLLDEVSKTLTHLLAGLCFQIDQNRTRGLEGHLFVHIRKSSI